jgi:hypothetical protein
MVLEDPPELVNRVLEVTTEPVCGVLDVLAELLFGVKVPT